MTLTQDTTRTGCDHRMSISASNDGVQVTYCSRAANVFNAAGQFCWQHDPEVRRHTAETRRKAAHAEMARSAAKYTRDRRFVQAAEEYVRESDECIGMDDARRIVSKLGTALLDAQAAYTRALGEQPR